MSDLDTRIALVEQRLMARDINVQLGFSEWVDRSRQAIQPRALVDRVGKALGISSAVALAGTGLAWLWRSRKPGLAMGGGSVGREEEGAGKSSAAGLFSLAGLVGLAWPLMPTSVTRSVSPGAARMAVSIAAPLAAQLFAAPKVAPLPAMTGVDPTRFEGTWYVLAHLPIRFGSHCDGIGLVQYDARRPGRMSLRVRCPEALDRPSLARARAARGVLRLVKGSGGGKYRLSTWPRWLRWLPMTWSDHWILHLDRRYREAIVGSPDRSALWVLSRSPGMSATGLQSLLAMAHDDGFDIDKLQFAAGVDPELQD